MWTILLYLCSICMSFVCLIMLTSIKGSKVELLWRDYSRPQSQIDCVLCLISRNWYIIRNSKNIFTIYPFLISIRIFNNLSKKFNRVRYVASRNLPRVSKLETMCKIWEYTSMYRYWRIDVDISLESSKLTSSQLSGTSSWPSAVIFWWNSPYLYLSP